MYKVTSTTYNTTVTDRTLTEGDRKMCIRDQSFQKIVDHVHVFMPCNCNRAVVSRNRYVVEKTVDNHKILINAITFYVCLQEI
jgi:hypothetical protein